jgi:hypothetical protein
MPQHDGRYTVEVRWLPEPCRWCWEIHDAGGLVESSWAADWMVFDSADEAWEAGHRRLQRLAA